MNNITYRKATKKDLEILFDLSVKFSTYSANESGDAEEFFKDGWEQYFREEILETLESKYATIIIAFDEEKPIAYIQAYFEKSGFFYLIDELYVDQEYRRMNLGKELLDRAIEFGKQFDCPIRVEVYNWNQSAINFYLKNKFKDTTKILELKP